MTRFHGVEVRQDRMSTDKQIERMVSAFVSQLREVVSQATKHEVAAAIQKALGARGGRRGALAALGPVDAAGRRAKRSPRQMTNQAERLYDHIKGNPGQRMEQIVEGINLPTSLLQPGPPWQWRNRQGAWW